MDAPDGFGNYQREVPVYLLLTRKGGLPYDSVAVHCLKHVATFAADLRADPVDLPDDEAEGLVGIGDKHRAAVEVLHAGLLVSRRADWDEPCFGEVELQVVSARLALQSVKHDLQHLHEATEEVGVVSVFRCFASEEADDSV